MWLMIKKRVQSLLSSRLSEGLCFSIIMAGSLNEKGKKKKKKGPVSLSEQPCMASFPTDESSTLPFFLSSVLFALSTWMVVK